jgi:peptidoglycan hydrolase-like protein with peptidoglycan-binding domain
MTLTIESWTPAVQPGASQNKGDQLADLIRGGIVPPGGIPSEPDPKIRQVQQRLSRLGYATVKPDGFMGPATSLAIEKFERERKLPVTGQASDRIARELAALTGRPVE